jgi:hypothetical protein
MKPNETPRQGDVLLTCSVGGEIEDEPAEVLGIAASGWIVLQTPRVRPATLDTHVFPDRNYGVVTLFRHRMNLHRVPGG